MNANNIIFSQVISEESEDYDSQYSMFEKRVSKYLVDKIIAPYNLITRRIGMVYHCQLAELEYEGFSGLYFRPEIKGINNFRFSKKETTPQGRMWSGNTNFINKIYTLGEVLPGIKGISYDYQLHLQPFKAEIRDLIDIFFGESKTAFKIDVCDKVVKKDD